MHHTTATLFLSSEECDNEVLLKEANEALSEPYEHNSVHNFDLTDDITHNGPFEEVSEPLYPVITGMAFDNWTKLDKYVVFDYFTLIFTCKANLNYFLYLKMA